MKYYKLYSDGHGESHWRDVEVGLEERTFAPPAQRILISDSEAAKAFVFLRLHVGWDEPIHPTPIPQALICLAGAVRVTARHEKSKEVTCGAWKI